MPTKIVGITTYGLTKTMITKTQMIDAKCCSMSKIVLGIVSSIDPMSLENLLRILPLGFSSKNLGCACSSL